jgi:hypothetical protein
MGKDTEGGGHNLVIANVKDRPQNCLRRSCFCLYFFLCTFTVVVKTWTWTELVFSLGFVLTTTIKCPAVCKFMVSALVTRSYASVTMIRPLSPGTSEHCASDRLQGRPVWQMAPNHLYLRQLSIEGFGWSGMWPCIHWFSGSWHFEGATALRKSVISNLRGVTDQKILIPTYTCL